MMRMPPSPPVPMTDILLHLDPHFYVQIDWRGSLGFWMGHETNPHTFLGAWTLEEMEGWGATPVRLIDVPHGDLDTARLWATLVKRCRDPEERADFLEDLHSQFQITRVATWRIRDETPITQ